MDTALLRRDCERTMGLLRSRFKKVVPVPLSEKHGCRSCGTVDEAKGPFTLSILFRGEDSELAVVTVATFCSSCYDQEGAQERVINEAMKLYRRMFA